MIFVDSNIPMYLVGGDDARKTDAQRIVERCIMQDERLVTDAEVLQEILHRYVAINRREAIQPAFELLLGMTDEVFPISQSNAMRARDIVLATAGLSARDAIHLAVMDERGVKKILSFDRGFDGQPGCTRIDS